MSKLEEQAKRLWEAAEQLNKVSDELNREVDVLNEEFKRLNLGIEAITPATDTLSLAYGKTKSRWGVLIIKMTAGKREVWHFSEAPRQHRLDVVDQLSHLLNAMTVAAQEKTLEIEKAVNTARQFMRETR